MSLNRGLEPEKWIRAPLVYEPPHQRFPCIVHLDEDLLVLSKPAGLLSVPGKDPAHKDCMELRARAMFPQALLTHRLDMATSGLMLMAMNKRAQSLIGKHFERRLIEKVYHARVLGHVEEESGMVDLPLCVDWPNRPMQKVCHVHGRAAQTHWRVLAREEAGGVATSLMELKPVTGRAHQLRVHMASLGHPIMGDALYAPDTGAERMMLHARVLTLHHPGDGALVRFEDALDIL